MLMNIQFVTHVYFLRGDSGEHAIGAGKITIAGFDVENELEKVLT